MPCTNHDSSSESSGSKQEDRPNRPESEPEALQTGWVIGKRVSSGHPGDRLSSAGKEGFTAFLRDIINLVDNWEGFGRCWIPQILRWTVGKEPFVVGVCPFSCCRIDPMIMDTFANLLTVCLQFLRASWKIPVNSRFREWIGYDHGNSGVFAGGSLGLSYSVLISMP